MQKTIILHRKLSDILGAFWFFIAWKNFQKNTCEVFCFKVALLTIFALSACNVAESQLMNQQSNMRLIERADHQKCVAQGIDFGEWDDVITEVYWRCRYNLAQDRMIKDATTPEAIKNNAMIKVLSDKIMENLNRSKQVVLSTIEDDVETSDHSKCVSMGYSLDSFDDTNIEAYYQCRRHLVQERTIPAPKVTHTFEAAVLPQKQFDQYLDMVKQSKKTSKEALIADAMIRQYPICEGLNYRSYEFQKCTKAQDESRECMSKLRSATEKKKLDNQLYCQKQAFIQFPDNYSDIIDKAAKQKQDEEKIKTVEELEKEKRNVAVSFLNSGEAMVNKSNPNRSAPEPKDKAKQQEKKLYSKIELLKLRERFMNRCNDSMMVKMPDFTEEFTNSCVAIGINWDKRD